MNHTCFAAVSRLYHLFLVFLSTPYLERLIFVAHKPTRNNTLNKVHVAATKLRQLLSQNTDMFGEATTKSCYQTLCSFKINWNLNCWKCLYSPAAVSLHWATLIFCPAEGRRLSWPEWLVTNRGGLPAHTWSVGHPS